MTHPTHRDLRGLQQGDVLTRWIKGGPTPALHEAARAAALYTVGAIGTLAVCYALITAWHMIPQIAGLQ